MITWGPLPILFAVVLPPAITAPVPKESDAAKFQRLYGTWSDAHNDSKFRFRGDELRIVLPAADRLLGMEREGATNDAPRAVREVEGDFAMVVRVTFSLPDQVPKKWWPYCSGGLLVWESEKAFMVIRRSGGKVNGNREAIWIQNRSRIDNTDIVQVPGKRASSSLYLRLTREGNRVTAGWSMDGKSWKDTEPLEVAWGDNVKVGIVAENCMDTPVEITFDQYNLTQSKK